MQTNLWHLKASVVTAVMAVIFGLGQFGLAQEISLAALQPIAPMHADAMEPSPFMISTTLVSQPRIGETHRFWDGENCLLFAATAGLATADFAVTRSNLRSGGQEYNPVTRVFSGSTVGLAANFVGETAGVVGLSYFFHRTGHHRLERAVSMVNLGSSEAAVTFGLLHR